MVLLCAWGLLIFDWLRGEIHQYAYDKRVMRSQADKQLAMSIAWIEVRMAKNRKTKRNEKVQKCVKADNVTILTTVHINSSAIASQL